jgi:16S rRNA (guanine966-N2)-methyltransferase
LRITGGEARGRVITGPAGKELRPTGSKVRQAFFNIVGFELKSASFLDLCAGTGLVGLEALSRGADSLIAVEENRRAARAIETNMRHLGYNGEVIYGDVRKVLPILNERSFDIIFADPPYECDLHEEIIQLVEKHDLLAVGGRLVIEHLRSQALPEKRGRLTRQSLRHYGQTSLSFYQRQESGAS